MSAYLSIMKGYAVILGPLESSWKKCVIMANLIESDVTAYGIKVYLEAHTYVHIPVLP